MAANSKVIALLSAVFTLATSGAVVALTMGRDRVAEPAIEEMCPAGACTIVTKSLDADRPSIVFNVPALAATPSPDTASPLRVATAEPTR